MTANKKWLTASAGSLLMCGSVYAGPEWVEGGRDAGPLPDVAQTTTGTTALTRITGRLTGNAATAGTGDFQDMYLINITDPKSFIATTAGLNGSGADFDTQLWLFDANGLGLLGNDDTFVIGLGEGGFSNGSTLLGFATDETGQMIPEPGLYLLAITPKFYLPTSNEGLIFDFGFSGEISGPDGAGAGAPIGAWSFLPPDFVAGGEDAPGDYVISLDGVELVPPEVLKLKLDVRPGKCPNKFNTHSHSKIPISIVATAGFDVRDIRINSLKLRRADGVGGYVRPIENNGAHTTISDKAKPYFGFLCGCKEYNHGDGIPDLNSKYRMHHMTRVLKLDEETPGTEVELVVTGKLDDGTPFEARDCIKITH